MRKTLSLKVVVALVLMATLGGAAVIAAIMFTYKVPTTFRVVHAYELTVTRDGAPVETYDWGDLLRTDSAQTPTWVITNVGDVPHYISWRTDPDPLPTGITMSMSIMGFGALPQDKYYELAVGATCEAFFELFTGQYAEPAIGDYAITLQIVASDTG